MEEIIQISNSLWLVVPHIHPDYDDGLITLRDDTGGDTLIDRVEIPKLIEALQKVVADSQQVSKPEIEASSEKVLDIMADRGLDLRPYRKKSE